MRDWMLGTAPGEFTSMAVHSDGSYGIEEGLIYSFPVTCSGGDYTIVQGLPVSDFARAKMTATEKELQEEKAATASV
jgi:malate dehydrogenase